jgi:hypothetical protein
VEKLQVPRSPPPHIAFFCNGGSESWNGKKIPGRKSGTTTRPLPRGGGKGGQENRVSLSHFFSPAVFRGCSAGAGAAVLFRGENSVIGDASLCFFSPAVFRGCSAGAGAAVLVGGENNAWRSCGFPAHLPPLVWYNHFLTRGESGSWNGINPWEKSGTTTRSLPRGGRKASRKTAQPSISTLFFSPLVFRGCSAEAGAAVLVGGENNAVGDEMHAVPRSPPPHIAFFCNGGSESWNGIDPWAKKRGGPQSAVKLTVKRSADSFRCIFPLPFPPGPSPGHPRVGATFLLARNPGKLAGY